MFCWHKWTEWEEYVETGYKVLVGFMYPESVRGKRFPYEENRQKRHCVKCGKVQDEKI